MLRKLFFIGTWELAIKQFISRHTRFHQFDWRKQGASSYIPKAGWWNYSRHYIKKPSLEAINLDIDTHFSIEGYDRTMNSKNIFRDLLRSFYFNGGESLMGARVSGSPKKKNEGWKISAGGKDLIGEKIIYASGRGLEDIRNDKTAVKVVASPLLVVYPALSEQCYVRMTPFYDKTVNHLSHSFKGDNYSLIGGGYFADPNSTDSMDDAVTKLKAMAKKVFPNLKDSTIVESYFSYKTEYVPKFGERNYKYKLQELDDGLYSVIPGKYSLAFSLAAHTFTRLTGKNPPMVNPGYTSYKVDEGIISLMKAEKIIARKCS